MHREDGKVAIYFSPSNFADLYSTSKEFLMYVYAKIKIKEMVIAKTDLFEEELQKRANLFKTLAHPARLQILQYLAQTRTCLSGDISDIFPLSRTTLNQHMHELKEAGLICCHLKGSKTVYCLDCDKIEEIKNILTGFLNEIDLPEDFCCEKRSIRKEAFLTV